jgi:hypothetical protein
MNKVSMELKSSIKLILEHYLIHEKVNKLDQEFTLQLLSERMSLLKKSKSKNYENLFNEYENEKYGPALAAHRNRNVTGASEILDAVVEEDPIITIRVLGEYYETTSKIAHKFYVDVIGLVFQKIQIDSLPLIELGAGEGLTLLPLYQKIHMNISKCLAIDLSPSGLDKLTIVGEQFGFEISTIALNIEEEIPVGLSEYNDGIVLTSFFLVCLPKIQKDYFQRIADLKPRYVLHFEPNYERLDESNLRDALCQDYTVKNNYNENFESQLREYLSGQDLYELFLDVEDVFGKNALLPCSIIGWKLKTID